MLQSALISVLRSALAPTACLALAASAVSAQTADSLFQDGIDAYRTGDADRAVELFKDALATNPGHDDIYRVWERAEQDVIRDMLIDRGELGVVTQRFLELARKGREAVASDPGGAEAVVAEYLSGDTLASREALLNLQATYGEWAVPALVGPLGDRSDIDRRVQALRALIHLGDQAVPALVQVLKSDDETTRTNAAAALGSIGDVRAAAALAWMARADESHIGRQLAADALGKLEDGMRDLGITNDDPEAITMGLAQAWIRQDPALVKPYASGQVAWTWTGNGLEGEPILGGLYGLVQARSALLTAQEAGAGSGMRAPLAAVHATMKAEIVEAGKLDGLDGSELLAAAQDRLAELDIALAGAGAARGDALQGLLAMGATVAATTLMESMGGSAAELEALHAALSGTHHGVSSHAALALVRMGATDGASVTALGSALSSVPHRLAFSIGSTGLDGDGEGWQHLSADDVATGLLRAKSFPPKDAVVIENGIGGVTLDSLVFGLENDPRTADVPVIVVVSADDFDAISTRYGETVAMVVSGRATWANVAAVAGDADALRTAAEQRAQAAAEALMSAPADRLAGLGSSVAAAASSGSDDVAIAALNLAARGAIVGALDAVESLVINSETSRDVRVAALLAAARLWAAQGGAAGDAEALAAAVAPLVAGDDHELAMAAASALGQLGAEHMSAVAAGGDELSEDQRAALASLGYVGG